MPFEFALIDFSTTTLEDMKQRTVERVQQYAAHLAEYRRQSYNETEVRIDFVNPLFKSLGWDVDNEAGLPQHLREVTHEATVLVEENGQRRSKKPDYSFRVGTETLFYLETKKPSVDITMDNSPAFQLRRYGWSGNLKISVLTNFNDLYIYDCTVIPMCGADKHDISVIDRLQREGKYEEILSYTDQVLLYDGLKLSEREVELLHSIWNKMRDRRLMRKQSIAD